MSSPNYLGNLLCFFYYSEILPLKAFMICSAHPEVQVTNDLERDPKASHGQVNYLVLEQSVLPSQRTLTPTIVRNNHYIYVKPSSVFMQHLTVAPYGDVRLSNNDATKIILKLVSYF